MRSAVAYSRVIVLQGLAADRRAKLTGMFLISFSQRHVDLIISGVHISSLDYQAQCLEYSHFEGHTARR
jgi:hypothetical protein